MMKEKGTSLVPTLMAGEYVAGRATVRHYPPEIAAKAAAALAARSAAFKRALDAGVKIAFGTDSGVSPHGLNAQEFALLAQNGMDDVFGLFLIDPELTWSSRHVDAEAFWRMQGIEPKKYRDLTSKAASMISSDDSLGQGLTDELAYVEFHSAPDFFFALARS